MSKGRMEALYEGQEVLGEELRKNRSQHVGRWLSG